MVKKINRRKCIELYNQLAHFEENNIFQGDNSFYPKVYASYTLSYQTTSFKEHAIVMAQEVAQLSKEFGYDYFLFFPNEDKAWIQDPGDREVSMDAIDFLLEHNVDPDFNGGLLVSMQILPQFLKHIMIMAHYSDDFPSINFIDEAQSFLCSICGHGNIHVDILNADCTNLSADAVAKSKLSLIENGLCHAIYADTNLSEKASSYLTI